MGARGIVFVVDDDERLRRATTMLLAECGYDAREFPSADAFLEAAAPDVFGCVLLDLRMPGRSGLELQEALATRGVLLPIVFLTGHADVPASVLAMKRGAIDFLEKPVAEDQLLAALDRALALGREQRDRARREAAVGALYGKLTEREREVFWLLASGRINKQAAHDLGIALRTVKHHRARVLEKMEADSLADLGRMALLLAPGLSVEDRRRYGLS